METSAGNNPSEPSKDSPTTQHTTKITISIISFIILCALLIAFLIETTCECIEDSPAPPLPPPPRHRDINIRKACSKTFFPSLCSATVSSIPATEDDPLSFTEILGFSINRTARHVDATRHKLLRRYKKHKLSQFEKNALDDCIEMLDQTLYELNLAVQDLSMGSKNLETLLSAAMTNEHTCIDGFSDLEELSAHYIPKSELQSSLTPTIKMISNCLAIAKFMHLESDSSQHRNPRFLSGLDWMTIGDRKLMRRTPISFSPNITVAIDGTGNYTNISEAVLLAPMMSENRYVIHIKSGVYAENIVIPRFKTNIMLIGDGMNSTILTGSRSFMDGFSTFTSATLTVVGDKFLARGLTIINTSGPEKHQAVALRVTSNSAFYHCTISAYQDTLYAHSLRQFYRECLIEGTVDFIFGNAAAIFQNCLILVRKPIYGQKNMITAQGRVDPNQNTGISLQNCTIMTSPDLSVSDRADFSTFLGRPWRNYSRTVVMKSYLGDLIHPQGWCKWNNDSEPGRVEYIEYMNFGPGSDTKGRVTWAANTNNCSEDIERKFTVSQFLHGADDWLESTVFPLFDFTTEVT